MLAILTEYMILSIIIVSWNMGWSTVQAQGGKEKMGLKKEAG